MKSYSICPFVSGLFLNACLILRTLALQWVRIQVGVAVTSRWVFNLDPLYNSYRSEPSYLIDRSPNYKVFTEALNSDDTNQHSGSSLLWEHPWSQTKISCCWLATITTMVTLTIWLWILLMIQVWHLTEYHSLFKSLTPCLPGHLRTLSSPPLYEKYLTQCKSKPQLDITSHLLEWLW